MFPVLMYNLITVCGKGESAFFPKVHTIFLLPRVEEMVISSSTVQCLLYCESAFCFHVGSLKTAFLSCGLCSSPYSLLCLHNNVFTVLLS
jgi:hypothetical protein